ncbi:RNA polymerase factor sigma-54 [Pelistega europaea]|uniref:RNA polymerase sigma-54 factor n=1 Tax=Pelistega europaea TaxID=106147 RepID=A0A7Y4L9X8_9BURK|nr:RNA polymerase factor sigma-54 [Pelistega europaea]NOL48621.1 RNA polymerase factor sigma-54 [Pelistega europaea]
MSVSLRQGITATVSQQMVMTVQQQQSLKLLQCSSQELEVELKKTLQENPLLEVESASFDEADGVAASTEDNSELSDEVYFSSSDEEDYIPEMTAPISLQDYLLEQLGTSQANDFQKMIISYLIGDLDDNGYLSTSWDELLALLEQALGQEVVDKEQWSLACEEALSILQGFEPFGVGARSLSECLLLQLDASRLAFEVDEEVLFIARTICERGLEALAQANLLSLEEMTHTDIEHIRQAHQLIRRLDPRPGKRYSTPEADLAIPDVLCRLKDGRWELTLNPQVLPRVRINPEYEQLLSVMDKKTLAQSPELNEQLKQARTFLTQLNQRFGTILAVAQTIMQEQYDFFAQGLSGLKPLTLKNIAEQLSLHESTISRAINQKFIATPHGVFELKRFFSSGLATQEGEQTSSTSIQQRIKYLIEQESKEKPLSDSKLTELLAKEGVEIARRTVAKYREAMGIPTASLRKAQAVLTG